MTHVFIVSVNDAFFDLLTLRWTVEKTQLFTIYLLLEVLVEILQTCSSDL